MQVHELVQIAALQALIALDFLLELEVERPERIQRALDPFWIEPGDLQPDFVLGETLLLFLKPAHDLLVLHFIADHGDPPLLMIPRGLPSRRDSRNAAGNSSSFPKRSQMPEP